MGSEQEPAWSAKMKASEEGVRVFTDLGNHWIGISQRISVLSVELATLVAEKQDYIDEERREEIKIRAEQLLDEQLDIIAQAMRGVAANAEGWLEEYGEGL